MSTGPPTKNRKPLSQRQKIKREDYIKKVWDEIEILDDEYVSHTTIDAPYIILKAVARINFLSAGFPDYMYCDAVENFYAVCRPFDTSDTLLKAIRKLDDLDTERLSLIRNPAQRKVEADRSRKKYAMKKFEVMLRFLGQKGLFGQFAMRPAKFAPDSERKVKKYELVG